MRVSEAATESLQRVFLQAFTARDLAEPLASFEHDAPAGAVRRWLENCGREAAGVRRDGFVAGYVETATLPDAGTCGDLAREFHPTILVHDTDPLVRVVRGLAHQPRVFVCTLGQVVGLITRADLQKAPMRMWLFGVVTLVELRYALWIDRHCPDDSWQQFLSATRVQKAQELLAERGRRQQTGLRLLDCLQFGDKAQIVARNEVLRRLTIFPSRRQAEEGMKKIEQLRNNLAHAQDIVSTDSDWELVVQLVDVVEQTFRQLAATGDVERADALDP